MAREINFVGEGKTLCTVWGFCEILLGNHEKLGDFTREFLDAGAEI